MKFRDFFSKRQILFALFLFAILIPMAMWDSGTQVKVTLNDDSLYIKSDRYNMTVEYSAIASAELTALADPGNKLEDGYDDDIIRYGSWKNDVWGTYYACIDPDTGNCIVLHLTDGRTFVFSRKNAETTAALYEQLLPYLN